MTPFENLADYVAIPQITALRLAPDGSWLAAAVQSPDADGKKFSTSIWRIDPGHAAPARLTRSGEGESSPAFLPDGSLAFVSRRPDPGAARQDREARKDKAAVWLLPAGGGEARPAASPPGGVTQLAAARAAQALAFTAAAFAGAATAEDDAKRRKAREDAGVTAILHEPGPVRYWDHDLGPDTPHLLTADAGEAATPAPADLTPDPGHALQEQSFELTPDGAAVVTGWRLFTENGDQRNEIAVIDASSGERRTLLSAPDADFESPRVSPDGRYVAALRSGHDSYDRPGDTTLVLADLRTAGGDGGGAPTAGRDLLPGFDRWPSEAAWAPDSASVYFTADDQGRCPVFRVGLDAAEPVRITGDDAAYSNLNPAPDGTALYALRASISEPPTPVRISLPAGAAGQAAAAEPVRLPAPGLPLEVPGRVEEITTTAADGTAIRGWLVLPAQASGQRPAPLLLWVHGGPQMSWNSWSWRWNPWLMAARGYAVLLPDPALSTGYGQHMMERGHGQWGAAPYTDVMAITDRAVERPDIDAGRTAMMGGSFGGYMANWIAGQTDRFRAIVSHAGLWALDQMFGTTDLPAYWRRIFGDPLRQPERYRSCSPSLHIDKIVTPMLVIHGDKDYRVPVGEALRLFWDLTGRGKQARFLYFPDENHWVLRPGDVRVWYETVLAFLAEHVLGQPWQRPELL
jgi:dipeptidyl aminopeptidase/acylaminoacyl peptidase